MFKIGYLGISPNWVKKHFFVFFFFKFITILVDDKKTNKINILPKQYLACMDIRSTKNKNQITYRNRMWARC